jgi:hypothetical protein
MPQAPVFFCTIATRSHVGQALACLRSVARFHPEARLALLAVGALELPADAPPLRVVPFEACVPARIARTMRARYSQAELCCAAKPYLIAHLLGNGAGEVHYLDADCFAYASLAPLSEQLAHADVLLTPHALSPIPDDGRTPRALTILRGGAFNAGYMGVRNTTEGTRFARWHGEMTHRHARNAPDEGMCFDQRWLDLVPALFPGAAICRDAGANVAYWNLHERSLAQDDTGAFRVNGEPLRFFHFSGYQPSRPAALSIHQNRHRARSNPALAALLAGYREQWPAARKSSWWKLGSRTRA